jgi:molybdate transport system regulatory protein
VNISARNRLHGTVSDIKLGQVMASVKLTLGDGQTVTAAITREAVEQLGLEVGVTAFAIVKATEVMLGTE